MRVRMGLVGVGKMGLSHLAVLGAHPDVELVGVCDESPLFTNVVSKYTGHPAFTNFTTFLRQAKPDAVLVATPSKSHPDLVERALRAGVAVFCEKPFCLDPADGQRLAKLADEAGIVTQVGYHYRFVGSFVEMQRLLAQGALGKLHHVSVAASGPVVLRPKGSTWRSHRAEGGGSLYDYACHAIDLMHFMVGRPDRVSGSILNSVFSRDVDDEVYSNFQFANGMSGRLAVNWSDASHRKMHTSVTVWGEKGKIVGTRQDLAIFLREDAAPAEQMAAGWTQRYTTDLTDPVWFYLRGEEYSAQIDHFVKAVQAGDTKTRCPFSAAADADLVAHAIMRDAERPGDGRVAIAEPERAASRARFWPFNASAAR